MIKELVSINAEINIVQNAEKTADGQTDFRVLSRSSKIGEDWTRCVSPSSSSDPAADTPIWTAPSEPRTTTLRPHPEPTGLRLTPRRKNGARFPPHRRLIDFIIDKLPTFSTRRTR